MVIAPELLQEIVAHARAEYDAECCGMVGYRPNGSSAPPRAVRVHRAQNIYASRKRFEIDGSEVLRVMNELDDAGLDLGAIYHSHTHTAPYPSQTDINFARNWPGVEWLIVGLAEQEPEVRCYLIDGGEVREVPIEVG
ncbi:MAG TPA: M67 family metallopeptidase [Solirubrobacteraceae bacterium]|jgi:proteasome lid subunit RPN8/RPN11|nr:M67 family metallopeptidase [Solirubrobacteraceae bacterium]